VLPDEPRQAPRGLVEVGLPERPGVLVPDPTHHVRVAIAEVLPLRDAQIAHRRLELGGSKLAEAAVVGGRVHLGDDDLAHLAARAGDEHDPAAVLYGLGHRASRSDRLIVGMGMDGHERQRAGSGRIGRIGHVRIVAATGTFVPGTSRPRSVILRP